MPADWTIHWEQGIKIDWEDRLRRVQDHAAVGFMIQHVAMGVKEKADIAHNTDNNVSAIHHYKPYNPKLL